MGEAKRRGNYQERKAAALAGPHASEEVKAAMKNARRRKRSLNEALRHAAMQGRRPIQ